MWIPSGKLLHNYWTWADMAIFHGKIKYFDWAIFNSYVKLPEGKYGREAASEAGKEKKTRKTTEFQEKEVEKWDVSSENQTWLRQESARISSWFSRSSRCPPIQGSNNRPLRGIYGYIICKKNTMCVNRLENISHILRENENFFSQTYLSG